MPLVGSYVNLDFDDKVRFIQKFGKDELSKFLRNAIREKLKEKNQEALANLSAIRHPDNNILTITQVNEGLDKYIQHADECNELIQITAIEAKGLTLVQHCKARYKKVRYGL